jgi:hypothetical protein
MLLLNVDKIFRDIHFLFPNQLFKRNSQYKIKRSLDIHLNRKNKCNYITPYQCKECKKYFKQNKSLIDHTIKLICKKNKQKHKRKRKKEKRKREERKREKDKKKRESE